MLGYASPRLVLCAVLLTIVTGCGGTDSGSGAITASGSPTRERPTAGVTRSPTSRPDSPRVSRTSEPRTSATPSSPASEPVTTAGTPGASASTAPANGAQADQSDDATEWWWLVLLVLVAGGGVAFLLARRGRSRRGWESGLEVAEGEIGWFARDLVPQLRGSGSFAAVRGGWTVASPRIDVLEDRLTGLVSSAPGDDERARAVAMRDAVRTARDRLTALLAGGESSQWSLALDDVQAPLLAVLVRVGTPAARGE